MTRVRRFGPLLAVLLLAGTACGTTEKKSSGTSATTGMESVPVKQGGIFRQSMGEPAALDPYNVSEANGNRVIKRLFVGLTTFDGNPDVVMRPGVAERWGSSPDCRQWTFNLRRGKFSNGEDVAGAARVLRGFKVVHVFAQSDTTGADLREVRPLLLEGGPWSPKATSSSA